MSDPEADTRGVEALSDEELWNSPRIVAFANQVAMHHAETLQDQLDAEVAKRREAERERDELQELGRWFDGVIELWTERNE